MTYPSLTAELRGQVGALEADLRERVEPSSGSHVLPDQGVFELWQEEYQLARSQERTAATWATWRDERITQAAVAWVLTTVFIRFCEDNELIRPVWISGPPARQQEAADGRAEFFRQHPQATDREWLQQAIHYFSGIPALRDLVDERSAIHFPLTISLSICNQASHGQHHPATTGRRHTCF